MRQGDGQGWFPGLTRPRMRFSHGWRLADGQTWDPEQLEGVELAGVRIDPPDTLVLDLLMEGCAERSFRFPGLAKLEIDGDLPTGLTECGWEVMGAAMIVARRERPDGRQVYMLDLPGSLLCFASFQGFDSSGR